MFYALNILLKKQALSKKHLYYFSNSTMEEQAGIWSLL